MAEEYDASDSGERDADTGALYEFCMALMEGVKEAHRQSAGTEIGSRTLGLVVLADFLTGIQEQLEALKESTDVLTAAVVRNGGVNPLRGRGKEN